MRIQTFRQRNTLPVLILSGDKDKVEPVDRVRAEVLGNLGAVEPELVVLEGVGHMLPIEAPKIVAHQIWNFVQRVVTPEGIDQGHGEF